MDPTLKALLLILAGAVVGYGFNRLSRNRDRKTDKVLSDEVVAIAEVKTRDLRITELERAVEQLQAKADAQAKAAIPIEAAMHAMLINKLTNAHTPEDDALLKKHTAGTLTVEDAVKFAEAMKRRETDPDDRIGEAQKIAAKILPDIIRMEELAEKVPPGELKTLMVTVPETEMIDSMDGGTQEQEKGN